MKKIRLVGLIGAVIMYM